MSATETISIPRAKTPESVGVDSKEVRAFIDHCMEKGKELHSIIVLRHGQVAVEAYRDPYGPDHAHAMYSVSKASPPPPSVLPSRRGISRWTRSLWTFFPKPAAKRKTRIWKS